MDDINNPNYCPLFFKGMYAWVDGHNSHVGHCCMSGISENIPAPDFYHPYLEKTRTSWNVSPRKDCKQCWDAEARGQTSNRQHYISWIKDLKSDLTTTELLRLDFTVGSVCNAKCIMCNAGSSTTWAAEDTKFGVKKYQHIIKAGADIDQISQIDVSKLKQIYFTGGEPFMSHRLIDMLKHIRLHGNISELEFSCNTNGSVEPSKELIELWQQCKDVNIYFSIDGTGNEFEYIRNPLKWNVVNSNIQFFKTLDVSINIAVSVGVHNIDIMPDIYAWFLSLSLPKSAFNVNRCWGDLNLDSASESLKQVWRENLRSIQQPWVSTVSSIIKTPGQRSDVVWEKWLDTIDRRRQLNWRADLPKLCVAKNKAACYTP